MAGVVSTSVRLIKPIVAGMALAFLVTAFVDTPAPVHFQQDDPLAAQQTAIVTSPAEMVVEMNVMKLGSPFTAPQEKKIDNPLERLADTPAEAQTAPSVGTVDAETTQGSVRSGVDTSE